MNIFWIKKRIYFFYPITPLARIIIFSSNTKPDVRKACVTKGRLSNINKAGALSKALITDVTLSVEELNYRKKPAKANREKSRREIVKLLMKLVNYKPPATK